MSDPFAFSRGGPRAAGSSSGSGGGAATGGFGAAASALAAHAAASAEPWHHHAPLPQSGPAPPGFGRSGGGGSGGGAALTGSMGPMQPQMLHPAPAAPAPAPAAFGAAAPPPSPASFAPFASDPMAQMGMAYVGKQLQGGIASSLPGVASALGSLRAYFAVNNGYVLKKLGLLLFPFRSSQFSRAGGSLPVSDANAPDLYIPSMAFITYVLSMGLNKGMLKEFHPDVLVATCTSTLLTHALEVCGVWAASYFLVADSGLSLLDLTAYTGYVYVPLVVNSLTGLLLGSTAYLVALAYTALAFAYFLVSTLQPLLADRAGGGLGGAAEAAAGAAAAGGARRTFALCIGALQLALLWWLGPRL